MRKISQKYLNNLDYNTKFEIRNKKTRLLELEYVVEFKEFEFQFKDTDIYYYWNVDMLNKYLEKNDYEIVEVGQ